MIFKVFPIILFLTLLIFPGSGFASGRKDKVRLAKIPFLKNRRLSWPVIPFIKGKFYKIGKSGKEPPALQQTKVKVAYDSENLYLLIHAEEDNMDRVVTLFSGPEVWRDDDLEIFIDTNMARATYFQFVVSVSGEKYAWSPERKGLSKGWSAKVTKGADWWAVEVILPLRLLGVVPSPGKILGVSFDRERRAGGELELSTWTPPIGFHRPQDFGYLVMNNYYDSLNLLSTSIRESLKGIAPFLPGIKDDGDGKIMTEVQKWQELAQVAEEYLKNRNLSDGEFFHWLKEWGKLKRSSKLKEIKYAIKIQTLLHQ